MHSVAEFGVAAHFLYKDGELLDNTLTERQSTRLVNIQKNVQNYQTHDRKNDFQENLSIELLDNNIFIYTPR
jgi:(p)ppGpp synthase/HD superfamily hydrolase